MQTAIEKWWNDPQVVRGGFLILLIMTVWLAGVTAGGGLGVYLNWHRSETNYTRLTIVETKIRAIQMVDQLTENQETMAANQQSILALLQQLTAPKGAQIGEIHGFAELQEVLERRKQKRSSRE